NRPRKVTRLTRRRQREPSSQRREHAQRRRSCGWCTAIAPRHRDLRGTSIAPTVRSRSLDDPTPCREAGAMSERSEFRPDDTSELKERWRAYVQDRRLNVTAQREAIVEQFLRTREHVSIDELLVKVRKRQPKVGYATVYRTLKLLVDSGLAVE